VEYIYCVNPTTLPFYRPFNDEEIEAETVLLFAKDHVVARRTKPATVALSCANIGRSHPDCWGSGVAGLETFRGQPQIVIRVVPLLKSVFLSHLGNGVAELNNVVFFLSIDHFYFRIESVHSVITLTNTSLCLVVQVTPENSGFT
jgi:hypothetical protein